MIKQINSQTNKYTNTFFIISNWYHTIQIRWSCWDLCCWAWWLGHWLMTAARQRTVERYKGPGRQCGAQSLLAGELPLERKCFMSKCNSTLSMVKAWLIHEPLMAHLNNTWTMHVNWVGPVGIVKLTTYMGMTIRYIRIHGRFSRRICKTIWLFDLLLVK